MDSTDLTVSSEDRIDAESVLIISAAAAFLVGLGIYLLRKKLMGEEPEDQPTDPPPIIIKSGSFTLESKDKFENEGGSARPWVYKKSGFPIYWARVLQYNDITGKWEPFKWYKNPTVQIWFSQIIIPGAVPDVVVGQNGADFELKLNTSKKPKFKNSSHATRKYKYEDDEHPETIRFRHLAINGENFTVADGDEFIIGFYNLPLT